jgi:hypothetical protein
METSTKQWKNIYKLSKVNGSPNWQSHQKSASAAKSS